MTTLLLSEIFPPKVGGSGRWFWELYRRLPPQDYVIAAGSDPHQEEIDATSGLTIHRLPLDLPRDGSLGKAALRQYFSTYRALRKICRQEKVKFIHAGRCLHEGLMALTLRYTTGIPYAVYTHGEEINLTNAEEKPTWRNRQIYTSKKLGLMTARVLFNARFIVANSQNSQRILTQRWGLPSQRVHVLHPGMDVSRFQPADPDSQAYADVRQQLGWADRTVVLTVGRLQKRKGHDMLISALPAIRQRVPNVLYAIVGGGEGRERLQNLAQEMGVADLVQFRGQVPDEELICCLQHCDLFALPNRRLETGDIEGFGIVLLEAQACGKPVVAGDSGGTAETMRQPETGQVVPCETPEPLAKLLGELLSDPERLRRMGDAGLEWVQQFDWAQLARKSQELFRRYHLERR